MTSPVIARLTDGLIPVGAGILACLYVYGPLGKRSSTDPRWIEWHRKYDGLLRILGPCLVLLGLVEMAASLRLPPPAPDPVESSSFCPTTVGSTWTYTSSGGDRIVRIPCHEVQLGVLCARREMSLNGSLLTTDHVRPEHGVVYQRTNQGHPCVPALPILKDLPGPLDWDYRSDHGGMMMHYHQAPGGPIKTPMATFNQTVLVTVTGKDEAGDVLSKQWFARDVGLVREQTQARGQELLLELKSYTH
jgi:hypothetical protein